MISIIDLTFNTAEFGTLDSWIIDEDLTTPSDHEMVVFDLANLEDTLVSMGTS